MIALTILACLVGLLVYYSPKMLANLLLEKWNKFFGTIDLLRLMITLKKTEEKSSLHGEGWIREWNERVKATPDKLFLIKVPNVFDGKQEMERENVRLTFAEADLLSNKVANLMIRKYFPNKDERKYQTVACLLRNEPMLIINWIGMAKAGLVGALLNTNVKGKALAHAIITALKHNHEGNSNILVIDYSLIQRLEDSDVKATISMLDLKVLVYAGCKQGTSINNTNARYSSYDKLLSMSEDISVPKLSGINWNRDPLILIYTSGTTGLPKAAKISHKRFVGAGLVVQKCARTNIDDILYCALPLYHSVGGMMGVSSCVLDGSTMVVKEHFSASKFAFDIAEYRCTVVQYIGELSRYALRAECLEAEERCRRTLRVAIGNGMRREVWDEFSLRFGCRIVEYCKYQSIKATYMI